MLHDRVLVEVWIPTAYLKKDMYLPLDMPVHLIVQMLERVVVKLTNHHYQLVADAQIFCIGKHKAFFNENTLRDYGVVNADILLIL